MALFECRKTGGGNQDLAIYGKLIYETTTGYEEYDVSNINEVIIKNVSIASGSANRKIYVYLDNTLTYTLLVGDAQTIDVSNINTLKIMVSNSATIVNYCLILKKCKSLSANFYQDWRDVTAYTYGIEFDISNFKTLSLKNTGSTSSASSRIVNLYMDNSREISNQVAVGNTLNLNIENNYRVNILANSGQAWVQYELTLS